MIELIQFPWSPYCIVQRRILEFSGTPFRVVNVPNGDRSLVWKLTQERYYQVPVVRNGRTVVFETGENSQVIAKYLDDLLQLDLFPRRWAGIQDLLWPYIEGEIEGLGFKLNDIYWKEFVPPADQLRFLRHKERKFGRGCLKAWKLDQRNLLKSLADHLIPFEQMLATRPFLLDDRPRFVDFDLLGILDNFLYSGHHRIAPRLKRLKDWHRRMCQVRR
ncbi:MAG TPA: glutathione S-transferase family protein [Verrucomicrobiales bacterium]|nr:glutathione S-transferase family protein [Verrucomicrobiales bacterium]